MPVTGEPWLGDACSLVDASRSGEISPTEALEGSLAAVEASSPFQFGISMITEVITVRTTTATISFAKGMPRIGRHSIHAA